ncbi:serine/threonine-protein kinase [Candidatus Uabimicrobium amorphum]|uniref:Protein kinase n=1 Tax=Uabimicrobium amorphum TaxID=2596890 RepID=A0A5S9F565_UABAM|nr:serine/threonine-protein kinase [Candidatus Uabimicrobium amorphum]BBM86282.1 protein kinase [Candidatus Uabimicrobium amorphum]
MDNDTFRSLWSKILEQDSLHKGSTKNNYKSEEMTFSHDITASPQQQTFSGDGTLSPNSPSSATPDTYDNTFSGDSTVSSQDKDSPRETFSENATLNSEDIEKKVTFSATETTAGKNESQVQVEFNATQDYQNYQEINRGGMGIIYKAEQTKLKREIAIKKTLPDADRGKFLAESLVTAYLEHPNIVPVHEIDHDQRNEVLLAMKLVRGTSWKDLLYPKTPEHKDKAKEYDLVKHLQILINVCNAIEYSHSKGIVHCDLKPDNIMIGDFGEVLVMDWGIAVDVRENPDQKRTVHKNEITTPLGTPCYMSPELAEGRGKDISYATDVYLLGGILCEILRRKPPHTGKSLWLVLLNAKKSRPVSFFSASIPAELQQVCHKAMSKEIQERYRSVFDFKNAIADFLNHQESIAISDKAQKLLVENQNWIKEWNNLDEIEKRVQTPLLYENFIKATFGFEQARELWDKNLTARRYELKSRLDHAKFALKNGDLQRVAFQMDFIKMSEDEVGRDYVVNELETIKEKWLLEKEQKRRVKKLKQSIKAILYLMFSFALLFQLPAELQYRNVVFTTIVIFLAIVPLITIIPKKSTDEVKRSIYLTKRAHLFVVILVYPIVIFTFINLSLEHKMGIFPFLLGVVYIVWIYRFFLPKKNKLTTN